MTTTLDLSEKHTPITDLFPTPQNTSPSDITQYQLTPDQIDFYNQNGYLANIKLLDDTQIDALRAELDEFFNPEHPGRELWYEYHSNESPDPNAVLFHALGAWRIKPAFHDLLFNLAMTVPASQLLDGPVRFWHDQLFCKPAHHGGVVAWHQDYSYWTRTTPMAHLTCWVGLDDSTVENGAVHYVPKSHTWDLLPITGLAGDMDAIKKVLTPEQWEQFNNPVPIELKKGHATFHHPLMVHGSFENKTAIPRRAAVVNLIRDGVTSNTNDPLLNGVPPTPQSQPLTGQFFPLLYQPS